MLSIILVANASEQRLANHFCRGGFERTHSLRPIPTNQYYRIVYMYLHCTVLAKQYLRLRNLKAASRRTIQSVDYSGIRIQGERNCSALRSASNGWHAPLGLLTISTSEVLATASPACDLQWSRLEIATMTEELGSLCARDPRENALALSVFVSCWRPRRLTCGAAAASVSSGTNCAPCRPTSRQRRHRVWPTFVLRPTLLRRDIPATHPLVCLLRKRA